MEASTKSEYIGILKILNELDEREMEKVYLAAKFLHLLKSMEGLKDKTYTPEKLDEMIELNFTLDAELQLKQA